MTKLQVEICALEYILTQGYSYNSIKDTEELNHLRFLYERYLKIKKIKEKL